MERVLKWFPFIFLVLGGAVTIGYYKHDITSIGAEIREATNINVIQTSAIAVLQERSEEQRRFEQEARADLKTILRELRHGR